MLVGAEQAAGMQSKVAGDKVVPTLPQVSTDGEATNPLAHRVVHVDPGLMLKPSTQGVSPTLVTPVGAAHAPEEQVKSCGVSVPKPQLR
jgi:hypothetical protein